MEPGIWIAVYMPMIVILILVIGQNQAMAYVAARRIRIRKRGQRMDNEMLKKSVGQKCWISSGSYGANITGTVVAIKDSWLEVESKKGQTTLINSDYVQQIRIL